MANRFTADTHFGHSNIIKYCARPFADAGAMTASLVERWNAVVAKEDTVYHLGDFSFYDPARSAEVLSSLNGKKILILGNHDRSAPKMLAMGFSEVHRSLELDGWLLVHRPPVGLYPMERVLCGHVHGAWRRRGNMYNVGVDVHDFYPVTIDEILRGKDNI